MGKSLIFKNTIILYLRSFFTLLVSLITARIVLKLLGVEDWGIYSVVGGFVSMFTFLNSSMSLAIQRYISYELATEKGCVIRILNISRTIILSITIGIFIIIEIIGSYYIINILNVPEEKRFLAFIVFQLSTFSLVANTLKVPLTAFTVSKERFDIFAYIDIITALTRLICVLLLCYFPNKLITYATFMFIITILSLVLQKKWCNKIFDEVNKYELIFDRIKAKEILSFTGWTTLSSIGIVLRGQLLNVLFNNYLGLIINAAYGIANQLNIAINGLISNIIMAFSPPIFKCYAAKKFEETESLLITSSKLCSILIMMIIIPLYLEINFILKIWLDEVPAFTTLITRWLIFISSLIFIMGNTAIVIRATGNVKKYELSMNILNLIFIILSYILLHYNYGLNYVFTTLTIITIIQLLYMLYLAAPIINMKYYYFIYEIVVKLLFTLPVPCLISYLCSTIGNNWYRLFLIILVNSILLLLMAYIIYLNKKEKKHITLLITKYIKRCRQ